LVRNHEAYSRATKTGALAKDHEAVITANEMIQPKGVSKGNIDTSANTGGKRTGEKRPRNSML